MRYRPYTDTHVLCVGWRGLDLDLAVSEAAAPPSRRRCAKRLSKAAPWHSRR